VSETVLRYTFGERMVHWTSAIRMWRAWRADMRITEADRRWGECIRYYVRNEDEQMPPIDRFNLGQKYFFWLMFYAGLILLLTGFVLWIPEFMPPALRAASVVLHAAAALLTIGGFIIHVYMGTAVVRGGFASIIRGEVTARWARHHHRLWYRRVTGND
jgi:formate dehydrogenase subunit gamma